MAPEGWDVEGVYYEPEEGVKASYSRSDMMREIGEIIDREFTDPQLSRGIVPPQYLKEILLQLGGKPPRQPKHPAKPLAERIAEIVGFELTRYGDEWNSFNHDNMWEILEALKQQNGDEE